MAVLPIITGSRDKLVAPESAANAAARTEQAAESLRPGTSSTDSPETHVRPVSVRLSIPLDSNANATPVVSHVATAERVVVPAQSQVHTTHSKNRLIRRDSLDRREAFLKGKEGSRQRRRWENGEWQIMHRSW